MSRPSLWFVVPVHGRHDLTVICLRQLRRTCDLLARHRIDATAVIVADTANLAELRQRLDGMLGFGSIERDNAFLSRKYNDGIQLALDPRVNPRPADYVVPCGSDDWIDHRILTHLPPADTVVGFQRISFVREDGREITTTFLNYPGGAGIRIYPRQLMAGLHYRPADEDRPRACDTSILTNLQRLHGHRMRIEHRHLHDAQIVDWKSPAEQLNTYEQIRRYGRGRHDDPFEQLADVYPVESLAEMQQHYQRRLVAA